MFHVDPSYSDASEIVTSDTVALTRPTRALMVTTAGVVKMTFASGATASFYMSPGYVYPFAVTLVWTNGTSYTSGILALY